MKLSLLLFLILGAAANCFSQSKTLKFSDESQLLLSGGASAYEDFEDTGRIINKEMIAIYTGMGKSSASYALGQFSESSGMIQSAKLTKKQRNRLFGKIDRINTAYSLKQGENEFYINGFKSVNFRQLDDCNSCEVKVRLTLLELRAKGKIYYSPYIESIEKIRDSAPSQAIAQ